MPKFEVTYTQSEIYRVVVEAEDKDAAKDIVDAMVDNKTIENYHYDSDGEFEAYKVG